MQGEVTLAIEPDHPAFAGHFPGAPILPGVVLLDAAVHAVLQAAGKASAQAARKMPGACHISSAKFLSPVMPGETLSIGYHATPSGSIRFEISGTGRKVAEGTLVLAPPP